MSRRASVRSDRPCRSDGQCRADDPDEQPRVRNGGALGEIAPPLLDWYDHHRRELPWRSQATPYRTLVSEFMLQQTGVATVIPYFTRFTKRFPDLPALAAAAESDVTAAWAGLGYYARARNLRRVAQLVMERHGGQLPTEESGLRALPGIGRYTAAAIAAIAFDQPTFALDGNAIRVVARLTGEGAPTDAPEVRERLRSAGQSWVPSRRAGDFAQAVMELGATLCRPRQPLCGACPLRGQCAAALTGRAEALPARVPKVAKRGLRWVALRIRARGFVVVGRRASGLLAGTFMLPSAVVGLRTGADQAGAAVAVLASTLGVRAARPALVGHVRHVFTHRDLTVVLYECVVTRRPAALVAGARTAEPWRWIRHPDVPFGVALSALTRKLLELPALPLAKADTGRISP